MIELLNHTHVLLDSFKVTIQIVTLKISIFVLPRVTHRCTGVDGTRVRLPGSGLANTARVDLKQRVSVQRLLD